MVNVLTPPLPNRGQHTVIIAVWMGRMTRTAINLSEAIRLNIRVCRATVASHRNLEASLAEGIPASISCAHRILDNQPKKKKMVDTNNAQRKKKAYSDSRAHAAVPEPTSTCGPTPYSTRTRQSARAFPRAPLRDHAINGNLSVAISTVTPHGSDPV